MRLSRAAMLALIVSASFAPMAKADWWKPGAGIKKMWGSSSSTSPTPPSRSASQPAARTASSNNSRTPTAPRESNLTFAPAPGAPQPSVTIPAATSPAGRTATAPPKRTWSNRFSGAMTATRNAFTIKPREVPVNDPVLLSGQPASPQPAVSVSAARVYESQGRTKEAREQYEKALKVDPQHTDAMVGLARLKHRDGDLASATELYQRALRANPNNAVVLNDLGLCYARRGMIDQARQSMEQAVAQDPRSKLYRNNLAVVLVEMNQYDAALENLQSVHGPAVAHYNLGYMLHEKGQHAAAAHHLQTALAIEPRMEPARQMLAQMQPPPAMDYGPQLGAPQVEPAPAPQMAREPQFAPRRDMPVNYRQEYEQQAPPQNAAPVQPAYPPAQNFAPPANNYNSYNVPQFEQQPPAGQYAPPTNGPIPPTAGGAQLNLSDDQSVAQAPYASSSPPHRPTVNYVPPPMNAAQPPANYVFPPAQATLPVETPAATEAPLPGDLPEYLRGQATAPPAPTAGRASRWSE